MITVKKLTAEDEKKKSIEACAVAFVYPCNFEKSLSMISENEKNGAMDTWGSFSEDGQIISTLRNHHFTANFDGNTVKCCGVGAVASMAESRSKGGIKKIYEKVFEEMYENKEIFSFLFPFSYEYYRKFGYECCASDLKASIKIDALSHFKCTCDVKMRRSGDEMLPYEEIHDAFIKKYNLACFRKPNQWRAFNGDGLTDAKYQYLFTENGENIAYIVFSRNTERMAEVEEIAFTKPDALSQVFGFLYNLRAQYDSINLRLPSDIPILSMLKNPHNVNIRQMHIGQMRIVNVKEALLAMRQPNGKGHYSLYINDEFFSKNNGAYYVTYQNGKTLSVEQQNSIPSKTNAILNIRAFSKLWSGFCNLSDLEFSGEIKINSNKAVLKKTFIKKAVFYMDNY